MQLSDSQYLEWHGKAWRQLWSSSSEPPHALLLTGPSGIGKGAFALAMAKRLLCESLSGDEACGQCLSCTWFEAGTHPDFRLVMPAADVSPDDAPRAEGKNASRQIVIDQIRELEEFVFLGGHRSGARVVVVNPAESMNLSAQNSLLKILEEPPASVYFILVSSSWRRLLPTVRSRARTLSLPRPAASDAAAWLKNHKQEGTRRLLALLGNSPLLAVGESESGRGQILLSVLATLSEPGDDPIALASRWQSQIQTKGGEGIGMDAFVQLVQKWLFALTLHKLSGTVSLKEHEEAIRTLSNRASLGGLIRCYNELMKFRALASHPLNPQLFLEDIAQRYLRALAAGSP